MNFIDAVVAISKRPDLDFCTDEDELSGKHPSICVYKDNLFIGKLRWPVNRAASEDRLAKVDPELEEELAKEKRKKK